jgi:WD40 repeat protein
MYVIKRVFEDHTLGVRDLAHFPDGSGFVSCSNDGSIRARKLDGSPLSSGTKITNPSSTTDEGHPVFGVVGYHECKYVSKKSPPEISRGL